MKATIHYDNGHTYPVKAIFSDIYNKKVLNHIQFTQNGTAYIIGKNKLAENGIIRVTKDSNEKTLWALNPEVNCAE